MTGKEVEGLKMCRQCSIYNFVALTGRDIDDDIMFPHCRGSGCWDIKRVKWFSVSGFRVRHSSLADTSAWYQSHMV